MTRLPPRRGIEDMNSGREISPELEHKQPRVLARYTKAARPSQIVEPRCGVCQHDYRSFIEMLLVKGSSYKSIEERITPKVSRQSISNHYKKHMDLQDAALRSLLEREAEIQGHNHEEGVADLITTRGALEVALRRGYESLIDKSTKVEARDLIQIVRTLADMDEGREQVGLEAARLQVEVFMEAIRQVVPQEYWSQIGEKVAELRTEDPQFMGYKGQGEIMVDAEVVEEPAILEDSEDNLALPPGD